MIIRVGQPDRALCLGQLSQADWNTSACVSVISDRKTETHHNVDRPYPYKMYHSYIHFFLLIYHNVFLKTKI